MYFFFFIEQGKIRTLTSKGTSVEFRESLRLYPINESPSPAHNEFGRSIGKRRELPPRLHFKETTRNSVGSSSTNRDSTSDMIMPSGMTSFLLDCMDCSSPGWSSGSSLPSPEVFRRAYNEDTLAFSVEEVVDMQVKNSTLLDASHAVDINMRQAPNLSSILARPQKCKKKVTFHESVLKRKVERGEGRTDGSYESKAVQKATSSTARPERPLGCLEMSPDLLLMDDVQSSPLLVEIEEDERGNSSREDSLTLLYETPPNTARFFDFSDSEEKRAFFQKREKPQFVFPSKPFKNSEVHDPDKVYEGCWFQLAHEGEKFFSNSNLKKVVTEEGVFYEDYGKVGQFHGQVFFPL
ncbi:hypothetical protein JZ751_022476 [Albula glossodonta]|uniref:Uncharacterized protein n=1 Tax=Albula glossodonta TaxID=121402 RepID=A0A8T2NHS5_9TELE|nr:hypothetical protein JZ751_022476 [Albula glossodonta]